MSATEIQKLRDEIDDLKRQLRRKKDKGWLTQMYLDSKENKK